jgi:hypothetical protein
MPSAFGMNASNSFGIMCGHFGTAPAVPSPPHGQHNVSVALYADQGCTSPSNASVVAVNPFVARSDSCVQNPYSSTDFPTYIKFACGLSGVGVQVFLDSGCKAAVSNGTLLPSDSCVTMPSAFGIAASNSFKIGCGSAVAPPGPPHGQRIVTQLFFYSDSGCAGLANASVVAVNPVSSSSDSCVGINAGGEVSYVRAAACGADVTVDIFIDANCQSHVTSLTQRNNSCDSSRSPGPMAAVKLVCTSTPMNATSAAASGTGAHTNAFPPVSSAASGGSEAQTNTFSPFASSETPSSSSNRRLLQYSHVSSAMFISSTSVKCFVPKADFGGR